MKCADAIRDGTSNTKMKKLLLACALWYANIDIASTLNAPASNYELKPISLPGATGAVALDYFAYDPATGKLWVPASNTGSVDVIDQKTDAVSQVSGFKTGEIERRGRKVTLGPTAASIGDGVVYIGNRGDATLCVIDAKTLACGECVPLSTDYSITPDGVLYVAATKEVWITTRPVSSSNVEAAKAQQVFDASDPRHLKRKTKTPLDGLGEGYVADNGRGLFTQTSKALGRPSRLMCERRKSFRNGTPAARMLVAWRWTLPENFFLSRAAITS